MHGQVLLFIIVPDNHNNKHVHSHTHIYREVYISTRITHINLEHVKVIGYVSSSKRYKFTSRLSCDTPPSQKVPARQQLFAMHYSHHHQLTTSHTHTIPNLPSHHLDHYSPTLCKPPDKTPFHIGVPEPTIRDDVFARPGSFVKERKAFLRTHPTFLHNW